MDVYSADVIKISQGVTNRGKEELARSYSEFLSKYKVHIVVKNRGSQNNLSANGV